MRKQTFRLTVILFTIGILLAKVSSFFVSVALTSQYGASLISDAIIISTSIPTILFSGFIAAIALCFVPIYKKVETENGGSKYLVMSNVFNCLGIIAVFMCGVLFLFPSHSVRLLASGISEEGLVLAAGITRWVAVGAFFSALTGLLQGFLQANNRFNLVSISALPINITLIICILMSNEANVSFIIGLGFLFAYIFQFILFFIAAKAVGFKWYPIVCPCNEYLLQLIKMVGPVLISTLIYDLNAVLDKNFASIVGVGNISVLDYAYKVAGTAQGVLAYPITTVLFTRLSEDGSRGNIQGVNATLNDGVKKMSIMMMPAISGLILISNRLVYLLFVRGSFTDDMATTTSICMVLYLVGMYAVSYRTLLEKALISLSKTSIVLYNSILTVAVNVVLNLLTFRKLGCYGLAMATSASMIVSAIFMASIIKRQNGCYLTNETRLSIRHALISLLFMIVSTFSISWALKGVSDNSFLRKAMALLAVVIIGIIAYVVPMLFFREFKILSKNKEG